MFTEWAPGAMELIIGVITIVGSLWTAIEVLKRRAEKNAEDIKADIKKSSDGDRTRLGRVEAVVERHGRQIEDIDSRMREGFRSVDARFSKVNEKLTTVASKDDVKKIEIGQARMESRLDGLAENDKRIEDMLRNQGNAFTALAAEMTRKINS